MTATHYLKQRAKEILPKAIKQLIIPRKIHAYCLGLPRTGTTSIAKIIQLPYRVDHEPEHDETTRTLKRYRDNEAELTRYIAKRDKRMWLDLESSWTVGYTAEIYAKLFPNAKYILTIRDCYSWLDSIFNLYLTFFAEGAEHKNNFFEGLFFKMLFGRGKLEYQPQESLLKEKSLYPLEGYFLGWKNFNQLVLDAIPAEQLLVLKTVEISQRLDKVADFLGVPAEFVSGKNSHSRPAKMKHNILQQLDQSFVESSVCKYCGDMMSLYFPEIKSMDQSPLGRKEN